MRLPPNLLKSVVGAALARGEARCHLKFRLGEARG